MNPSTHRVVVALGVATLFLREAASANDSQLPAVPNRIIPAALLDQVEIFVDADHEPIALVSWAWVTPQVLQSLRHRPVETLHLSEWREGEIALIVDLFVRKGHVRSLRQLLAKDWLAEECELYWISRRTSKVCRATRRGSVRGH